MRWLSLLTFTIPIFLSACSAQVPEHITTFEQCVAAGYPVLRTFPARCVTADQTVFLDLKSGSGAKPLCKDLCGDGKCDEIVCMAEGCPCPESAATCPKDCSSEPVAK